LSSSSSSSLRAGEADRLDDDDEDDDEHEKGQVGLLPELGAALSWSRLTIGAEPVQCGMCRLPQGPAEESTG